jgi:hypothetical protein
MYNIHLSYVTSLTESNWVNPGNSLNSLASWSHQTLIIQLITMGEKNQFFRKCLIMDLFHTVQQQQIYRGGQNSCECAEHRVHSCKGKAVPLQACSGPEGSSKLRFPDYMTTAQDSGKVVSLMHRPPLPSENAPGTHFYYRLSRPQGHIAIGRIMSMKNSNDTIWNRTSDLPSCSTVP